MLQTKIGCILLILALFSAAACTPSSASNSPSTMAEPALRHVVLFKFKDEATPEAVEALHASFQALPAAIPAIQAFEWGLNDSPEDLHQGFTHCYMLTFKSEADRDSIYSPHPAHQAFVKSLQDDLEKAFVVDYWANQ